MASDSHLQREPGPTPAPRQAARPSSGVRPAEQAGSVPDDADAKLLLSVGEAAQLVGLSERTVWKLSGCGELPPPIRIGRSVRWLRQRLDDFLAERKRAAEKVTIAGRRRP